MAHSSDWLDSPHRSLVTAGGYREPRCRSVRLLPSGTHFPQPPVHRNAETDLGRMAHHHWKGLTGTSARNLLFGTYASCPHTPPQRVPRSSIGHSAGSIAVFATASRAAPMGNEIA